MSFCILMLCQTNPRNSRRWMEPFLCSSRVWLTSSSSSTCSPQTRGSGIKTGETYFNQVFSLQIFLRQLTTALRHDFRFRIVALHSTLSSKDQAAAFTLPPAGVRKVLLNVGQLMLKLSHITADAFALKLCNLD